MMRYVRCGEDGAPVAGKLMVARALRCSSPLRRVTSACHGPSGICLSSMMMIGSVAPIARVVPRLAANGPALSPPGPEESCMVPLMSSARPPVLWTLATTSGWPSGERLPVSESIVKLEAGAPPGPIER